MARALRGVAMFAVDAGEWMAERADLLDPSGLERLGALSEPTRVVLYTVDTSGTWTGATDASTVQFKWTGGAA